MNIGQMFPLSIHQKYSIVKHLCLTEKGIGMEDAKILVRINQKSIRDFIEITAKVMAIKAVSNMSDYDFSKAVRAIMDSKLFEGDENDTV